MCIFGEMQKNVQKKAPRVQNLQLGSSWSRLLQPYLASGQGLPPFCGHLIDDLLPKLGRQLVALGTPPLDDG